MPDWTRSMQQTYEFYEVNPNTWKDLRRLTNVKSCTITRDADAETLGSATFDITESVGECYIRVYLITIQDGIRERHPLGTYLVQTPASSFDGKVRSVSMDAYTPLLELKENPPPLGYSILKGENIMERAYQLTREHVRAPVVKPDTVSDNGTMTYDFVANTDDTWMTYLNDLIANAKVEYTIPEGEKDKHVPYHVGYRFALDEMGRILFAPKQDISSLQPVWTYTDDNSSILYPEFDMDHDLYGIPNVVEVFCTSGTDNYHVRVENRDPNSPTSINKRGREIIYRVVDPDLVGEWTYAQIIEYAKQILREVSTIEYTITYSHGYCPVRLEDCIRLNYSRAGLTDTKAKVINQIIKCTNGCPVTEKAVFTVKLVHDITVVGGDY